jgi:hypothetical protein
MQMDLSNHVIARIDRGNAVSSPRRTLDLENIYTPELGLLSPRRTEIAPRGAGRDAALVAYSERLRQSYRTNEGGIRDGMLKLGNAYRDGQTISVSCFCRAGEVCHADVIKMAIEKVGKSLDRGVVRERPQEVIERAVADRFPNPRTERAVNEILSVGRSELLLTKLDDTEGRNRSEHASHLNRQSQFIRDLYERGAVVRDGVLITPKDHLSPSSPLAIETNEFAVKRLEQLTDISKARELAPKIVDYATKIAGTTADRDTKIKVFSWIYGALEGRSELLKADNPVPKDETKDERFDRVLGEIASLADQMSKLEPSDKSIQAEQLIEHQDVEKEWVQDDRNLERIYEEAILAEEHAAQTESDQSDPGTQEFERTELEDVTLSRLAGDMSQDELDRWINIRLPVLDEMLESGTPVEAILKPYQNEIYQAVKNDPMNKQAAIDDLKFASAYVDHQLKQPESRLRHFNPRYREYATLLERAGSREEVIDAASRIRLENAQLGFRWNDLLKKEKAETSRPLTAKEMQFLFTEASPRHYTGEMTVTRLSYSNAGEAARAKTDALMRGEITSSKEAMQMIESLESRLDRRRSTDSLSATKHFLQSLKTPNEELRFRNAFDHAEVYRKLPPAERDFVYQRAVLQKERLEAKSIGSPQNELGPKQEQAQTENVSAKIGTTLREALKGDLVELLTRNPEIKGRELADRTSWIIESKLETLGSKMASEDAVISWSRDVGAGMSQLLQTEIEHRRGANERDRGPHGRRTPDTRTPTNQAYER